MKPSAFPITIEVEVKIDGIWQVTHTLVASDKGKLYLKMQSIKTLLGLNNKNYRIIFIVNSKVNILLKE
jgi:hypothetical protein